MIFQELSHSLLVKLNAFISKVRLMHLHHEMIGFKCLDIIHKKILSKIKPSIYLLK